MFSNELKDFYSKLQDDESRRIFFHRFNYFLTQDYSHIKKMIAETFDFWGSDNNSLLAKYTPEKRVVLYGAGGFSSCALKYFNGINIPVSCFCDSDYKKIGTFHLGLPVISLDSLDRKNDLICISSLIFQNEIYENLLKLNYNNVFNVFRFGKQYYLNEIKALPLKKNGVYIDAGCLDGLTINDYIKFTGADYARIYGFEPDPDSFERTQKFISDNNIENTYIFKKGLWSEECVLSFNNGLGGSSTISSVGNLKINCVTIDSVVKDEIVSMIKMDIEGAELEALKGAVNTIRKSKPLLAICIYHKPEDILDIPLFIQTLVPEYRFFIRHHHPDRCETVLYAIVTD